MLQLVLLFCTQFCELEIKKKLNDILDIRSFFKKTEEPIAGLAGKKSSNSTQILDI